MMGIAKLKRVVIIMSVILGLIIIIGTAYTFFEEDTPGGPPKPIIPKNVSCMNIDPVLSLQSMSYYLDK